MTARACGRNADPLPLRVAARARQLRVAAVEGKDRGLVIERGRRRR